MESFEEAYAKNSGTAGIRDPPRRRGFFVAQVLLRCLAIAFTATAIAVMVTAKQTIEILGLNVSYNYLAAFKFLVIANAIICGFSLLSLIFITIFSKGKSDQSFLIYLHDLILTLLSMSGCAAAIAIGYVGKYGQEQATWFAVCETVGKFCKKAEVAIILSVIGFLCLFVLTVMAARNLRV